MRSKLHLTLLFALVAIMSQAQEKVLASYFDIPVGSKAGTEVMGRIHLERNKDVRTNPIPATYHFEIISQQENIFKVETRFDVSKRITGVLAVDENASVSLSPKNYPLTIALKDGKKEINRFDIQIKAVEKTLWQVLYDRYAPTTLKNPRMYGKHRFNDKEIANLIEELKSNDWKFNNVNQAYTIHPAMYKGNEDERVVYSGTIDYDWIKIANKIGGMGYAYATSKIYGPKGNAAKRAALKNALYQAILAYTHSVPVYGDDLSVDGKPIGKYTGDGFSLLENRRWVSREVATHQWLMTDPLVVPSIFLMSDIIKGMQEKDKVCLEVHDALIRYNQVFFSIVKNRRAIDNPKQRWGEIQDTLRSSGAWADANLGHRIRGMLAYPIIWADYNRPLTYVDYWYSDFYHDKPYKGFSFSPGWNPHGVVSDVAYWLTKFNVPAYKYIQSGFLPDGTIAHHIGHGTDAAMVSYGFGWLTDVNEGFSYFKDTDFSLPAKYYQFELDYLLNLYPKLFYKQRMDWLVSGRSYLDNLKSFVNSNYVGAVESLLKAQSKHTQLQNMNKLLKRCNEIKANTYEHSGTTAYWCNEFLVHRKGEQEKPFYASLKLKSERTVGAEDFSKKIRKSWHAGYGILQVKVNGDEYSEQVLKNFDWHALPGLTEEWRTDPLPLKGGSQGSLPSLNKISGVLSDGDNGMGIYHHLTKEMYSVASAYKSYHFIDDKIIALGSGISRVRPGQQQQIATFIDQSIFNGELTWNINGKKHSAQPNESLSLDFATNEVCWLHHGNKGYVILPARQLNIMIKTGKEINTTDRKLANTVPNFIIAASHGVHPGKEFDNSYTYYVLPNTTVGEMPQRVKDLKKDLQYKINDATAHAVHSKKSKYWQFALFSPQSIECGGVEVSSDHAVQIMIKDKGDKWTLSVNNPAPDINQRQLSFTVSVPLTPGTYAYNTGGISPQEGETVSVRRQGYGAKVVVELPDIRDEKKYNYQTELYSATPIVISIPK